MTSVPYRDYFILQYQKFKHQKCRLKFTWNWLPVFCTVFVISSEILAKWCYDGDAMMVLQSGGMTFDWSAETRSLVLGSFFYGYAVTQLPGGLLSTYWNSQHVFSLAISLSGLLCALMPFMAQCNVNLLITARFLMGFIQVHSPLTIMI